MKSGVILVVLAALSGCSNLKPYGYVYLQKPIESETDYWIHPSRSWQCDAPWFKGGIGMEHKTGVRVGLHHHSTLPCGGPFNGKPEVDYNAIEIGGDWGGWKL